MNVKRIPLVRTVFFAALLALAGCATPSRDTLTQVATIDALLAGVYDGHLTLTELRAQGDFGIGTFEALDGEMILVNGAFYQARADGSIRSPALTERTPFACVTWFEADAERPLANRLDAPGLEAAIDALAPHPNRFCAFHLSGEFARVRVRSVPAQTKPYPPLAEVTKTQPVFDLENVRGVLIGFRSPPFVRGVNVPGFHMHFIADNLSGGGHVLSFELEHGLLRVDTRHDRLTLILPPDSAAFDGADLARDRSAELNRVEK